MFNEWMSRTNKKVEKKTFSLLKIKVLRAMDKLRISIDDDIGRVKYKITEPRRDCCSLHPTDS